MNQELFFSDSQWKTMRDFAQSLEDAYYSVLNSEFDGHARERFALALKAATSNLACDLTDPEFFLKIARGIRRLPVTDKITVYGDGVGDFGVHVIQAVGNMVAEKISRELNRTGLWRRVSYNHCYRAAATDFFAQIRNGDEYPLMTVRFLWTEKDAMQAYDCSLNALLIQLARIPNDTKINEAVKIFKPFLTGINCVGLNTVSDTRRRGWWGKNAEVNNEEAGS